MSNDTMTTHAAPPKYLKQAGSGRIYPYTAELAKRADMTPHEGELPAGEPADTNDRATGAGVAGRKTEGASKHERLVVAIGTLKAADFTKDGKPKLDTLEAAIDDNVTAAERDAAWDEYQQQNPSTA